MTDKRAFLKWLGKRESGRDDPESYGVINQLHFLGKYQQGEGILHDLQYYNDDTGYYPGGGKTTNTWNGIWLGEHGIVSTEEFLQNKNNVQEKAIEEEMDLNWKRICAEVPNASKRDAQAALLAGAHLCGPWAVISYLKTGTVAQDENGTRLTEYMDEGRRFSSSA